MKVELGVERWVIRPETQEEYLIFLDYMTRLPKVVVSWDTVCDISLIKRTMQTRESMWAGMFDAPYMVLDFDLDENLEQT